MTIKPNCTLQYNKGKDLNEVLQMFATMFYNKNITCGRIFLKWPNYIMKNYPLVIFLLTNLIANTYNLYLSFVLQRTKMKYISIPARFQDNLNLRPSENSTDYSKYTTTTDQSLQQSQLRICVWRVPH